MSSELSLRLLNVLICYRNNSQSGFAVLATVEPDITMYQGTGRITWLVHRYIEVCNGNRTEWSPIRSVIIRVITKFVYHEYDYRPNWTTQSLITN